MGDEVMQLTAMQGCEAAEMQDAGPRSLTLSCGSLFSCLPLRYQYRMMTRALRLLQLIAGW